MLDNETDTTPDSIPWPNKQEPLDGVVPTETIPQTPDFMSPNADHTSVQMGG